MGYWQGFKAEAHAIAKEIRAELGLHDLDPLDPRRLAEHLEIPIIGLSDYVEDAPNALRHFTEHEPEAFSAATVFDGNRRLIVHNDSHVAGRQNSNLSHELSHGLLLHPPTPAIDDRGCRTWNQDLEDEAAFLGAALLLTEGACLYIVKRDIALAVAAERYGVTIRLLQWRINATGSRKRIERAHAARR